MSFAAARFLSAAPAGVALGMVASRAICGDDVDYNAVKESIKATIEADESKRGDGSSLAGTFVRLAWHCSGTYSAKDGTGGSNGATMRFEPESAWGANAGLNIARDALEPVKAQFPGISYADLYTLSGVASVEYMGGPETPWKAGRTDMDGPDGVPDGRLPDADKGQAGKTVAHIRDIFGRMGFNDREMVALIGAHAVGRCHTDASGYWGPWTRAETTFSNEYFRLLLEEPWTLKTTHKGKAWSGPEQFEDASGELMMLPSDIALVQDAAFRKWVKAYADDEELFFKDFSAAFSKLLALGVKFPGSGGVGGILAFLKGLIGL